MPYEFTYLKTHGSPGELIDRALGIIEDWLDRYFVSECEAAGHSDVYSILGRLSLKDKLDAHIPEGVDNLGDEYWERYFWQEVYDLVALRPEMDSADAHAKLRAWLEEQGWYDPEFMISGAPEPLHAELQLRTALDGSLVYLAAYFEELAVINATVTA